MASGLPSKYMSTSEEYPLHFHGWLRIHKDGRCERLIGNDIIPAGTDPITGVKSKDVVISHQSNVFVRLYIPKTIIPGRKLPTLVYYHGGGFLTESAASPTYHLTLNLITTESNVIVVSVNYRLNDHADLQNVFFGGDSAGANIAHNMGIRVGLNHVNFINLKGVIMLHPYFGGKDPIGDEPKHEQHKAFMDQMWLLASPLGIGLDDPLFNPAMDPFISGFGCSKILVCVGEKDKLKGRGLNYKKVMENNKWKGKVELMESKGVGHVFFLSNTSCENARILRNRICTFINPISSKI